MRIASVVLVLALAVGSTAQAAPAACVISSRSVSLDDVTIRPPGDEPFQLGLRGVPAIAHLPARCGAPLSLEVKGSLAFSAERDKIWLSIARDITTSDGLVTLKRGSSVIDACQRGGRVFVSAVLQSDDVLDGEHKPADEQIDGVEVPCDALSLDAIELADDEIVPMQKEADTARFWKPRASETATSIQLRSAPREGAASRRLAAPAAYGTILFVERKSKGSWLFVEAEGLGVHARGWIQRRLLVREPDASYGSFGCTGDHQSGMSGFGFSNAVEHTATVRIGTTVYYNQGTSPWAVFTQDETVKVWITPGSKWASLSEVSGLDDGILGQVALDALRLDPTP